MFASSSHSPCLLQYIVEQDDKVEAVKFPAPHGTGKHVPSNFLLQLCRSALPANVDVSLRINFFNADGTARSKKEVADEIKMLQDAMERNTQQVELLLGGKSLFEAEDDLLLPLFSLFVYVALEPRFAPFNLAQFAAGSLPLLTILSANALTTMRVYTAWLLMGKGDSSVKQWFARPEVVADLGKVEKVTREELSDGEGGQLERVKDLEAKLRQRFKWCKMSAVVISVLFRNTIF